MSKRILVVEDQPDNRQIIRDMLAGTDYEITEAEDGEQALAAVAKARPDLVSNCPSWTATRSRAKSRPIPRCDRFRSSPSPPTRWMGKNRQRERQDVMTMCRNLTALGSYWRKFGSTCPDRSRSIASSQQLRVMSAIWLLRPAVTRCGNMRRSA